MLENFVLHSKSVTKAMELLLKKEKGDRNILVPAAIVHDIGWAKVPIKLQRSQNEEDRIEALKLHIKYAPEIISKILGGLGYKKERIEKIIDIVVAHKFQNPEELDKRLLIDADTLSDCFKEDFYSNVKAYGETPKKHWRSWMKNNRFYTSTAKKIFDEEMKKRILDFL
ncbi:MAG: HD domain-containing protein [Nanoarchaeota archaeon]|nr:HD domain-containing protein [Nanoarchaeota archaeon]